MNSTEIKQTVWPLEICGKTATVNAAGGAVTIPAEAASALREIETLVIPRTVELFQGLNRFENL